MPSLDEMLKDVQQSQTNPHHGAVIAAARTELARLMQPPSEGLCSIEVGTILSHRTKRGMVEFILNQEKTQMDLEKAREVLGMLSGAIEAAVSDTLIYQFLTEKVGLSDEKASQALLDFRELRQGSRRTVYPS